MSGLIYHSDERRILPKIERSKSYSEKRVIRTMENISIKNDLIIQFKDDDIESKIEKWEKDKDDATAGEILSHAIVTNDKENIIKLKKFLKLDDKVHSNNSLVENLGEEDIIKFNIAQNKKKLIEEPKDSIRWIDQAINYFELGHVEKSKKCIDSALTINNDFGFILRNASRLLNHFGDTGRAIDILKKSQYYKYDPQILSAEIAFSQMERRKTKGYDFGRKLLNEKSFTKFQISELAGAIGTNEYFDGNFSKSEKLFDLSLEDPSENSFAQSLWYKKKPIEKGKFKLYQKSNEIQTHVNTKLNKFEESLDYAKSWIHDEKFSIRPYRAASHLTGVMLENYPEAFDIAKQALITQKIIKGKLDQDEEFGLINDLAYYSLKEGDIKKSFQYIQPMMGVITKSSNLKDLDSINLATIGLFAYKTGQPDLGKNMYRKAMKYFSKKEDFYYASSAFLNFFDEEILVEKNIDTLQKLRKELDAMVTQNSENDLIFVKEKSIVKYENRIRELTNYNLTS
jgi:hypothetical protein